MIAIVFVAIGLAMARYVLETQILTWWYTYLIVGGIPMAGSGTILILALNLRRPRPPIRRLIRHAGISECVAVLPILSLWGGIIGYGLFHGNVLGPLNRFTHVGVSGGATVLGVWFLRLAAGTGQRPRGWLDRSGQAIGLLWILLLFLILYHEVL
jgi:hypothetical protein